MRPGSILWPVLASTLSLAQLTIENPKHLRVPEDYARLLLRTSCRAVANELHVRGSSIPEFGVHLVLGSKDDRAGYDQNTGMATVFLREWNDKKFATAAIKLALDYAISKSRKEELVRDVLSRSARGAPVSAIDLEKSVGPSRVEQIERGDGTAVDVGPQPQQIHPISDGEH